MTDQVSKTKNAKVVRHKCKYGSEENEHPKWHYKPKFQWKLQTPISLKVRNIIFEINTNMSCRISSTFSQTFREYLTTFQRWTVPSSYFNQYWQSYVAWQNEKNIPCFERKGQFVNKLQKIYGSRYIQIYLNEIASQKVDDLTFLVDQVEAFRM